MHFSKKSGRRSSVGPVILAFVGHCSANFQPISDCVTQNFKLKYEDSENIKTDHVDTIVFNLHEIKHRAFLGVGGGGRHPLEQYKLSANIVTFILLCSFFMKRPKYILFWS